MIFRGLEKSAGKPTVIADPGSLYLAQMAFGHAPNLRDDGLLF
jgi:hypothetical protein